MTKKDVKETEVTYPKGTEPNKVATQDSVSVSISKYMARRVEIQKEVSKHNEAIRVLTEEFFRLEGGILALQELLNKEIVKSKEDK